MNVPAAPTPRDFVPIAFGARQAHPERVHERVYIREVPPNEPLPPWFVARVRGGQAGMSRAAPRYLAGDHVIGFIAERGGGETGHPIAVVWCACGPGRSTVTVEFARRSTADDALMSRLFLLMRDAARAQGAQWVRWRLSPQELPLLEAIRIAVGAAVLHREGDVVVAEVAAGKAMRSR